MVSTSLIPLGPLLPVQATYPILPCVATFSPPLTEEPVRRIITDRRRLTTRAV